MMELADLIGMHKLSGVDFSIVSIERYRDFEDANVMNFVLDGKTYTVTENPVDGYRSAIDEIKVSDFMVTNTFEPIDVLCTMDQGEDILSMFDVITGKQILSVGTDYSDSYYPHFVMDWLPENLAHNSGKE